MRFIIIIIACVLTAAPALAQGDQRETTLGAEFRLEGEAIKEDCKSFKTFVSCASTLATNHPVHVAIGSIAPQNGFAFGPAIVAERPIGENWRFSWSGDVVGASGGAWRAGAYLKMVRTGVRLPNPVPAGAGSDASKGINPYPVVNIYAQNISLPTVSYFGLGPNTTLSMKSIFEMQQAIVGTSAIYPVARLGRLNLSLVGEANGRFVDVGGANTDQGPSIDQLYTPLTAPGLATQPGFAQFAEGVRIMPRLADGRVRLNYLGTFQQFLAASDSTVSFRRWTLDLSNEFALYRTVAPPLTRDANGPNACGVSPGDLRCPPMIPPAASRNYTGSIGFRFFVSKSGVSTGNVVPFYFQQTIGGSDINGNRILPSYEDYRFRGPHLLVLQESFEHSLFKTPVGIWLAAEQGQVALQQESLSFDNMIRSYTFGLTLRAGGFPAVIASWSTGSSEGHHFAFTINTSLLGGSSRPSLQ
jgi:hypothetical protein